MTVSFEEWLKRQETKLTKLFPSIFKDGYFATVIDLNKDTNNHINK